MLIEARIPPSSKHALRSIIEGTTRKYHLTSHQYHRVPHLTLYGAFDIQKYNSRPLIVLLQEICCKYEPMRLTFNGFGAIQSHNQNVIYFNPRPLDQLRHIRREMRDSLAPLVDFTQKWDKARFLEAILGDNYTYHVSLAYNLPDTKFNTMWQEFQNKEFNRCINLQRITLLSNASRIIVEYDMKEKALLTRDEALQRKYW